MHRARLHHSLRYWMGAVAAQTPHITIASRRLEPPRLFWMLRLDTLATEVVLTIVEYLAVTPDFAAPRDNDHPSPLKSLAQSCRRLYAICFPFLFQSLRLSLERNRALQSINALRRFLWQHGLQRSVQSVIVVLGSAWNEGKVGIELKKFLWELQVNSLTLSKERGQAAAKEKSAKWPYFLDTVDSLRLETIDDDSELKMLLLRQCPARLVHVEDGDFRDFYNRTDGWSLHKQPPPEPAIVALKPSVFPNLKTLIYFAVPCPTISCGWTTS